MSKFSEKNGTRNSRKIGIDLCRKAVFLSDRGNVIRLTDPDLVKNEAIRFEHVLCPLGDGAVENESVLAAVKSSVRLEKHFTLKRRNNVRGNIGRIRYHGIVLSSLKEILRKRIGLS